MYYGAFIPPKAKKETDTVNKLDRLDRYLLVSEQGGKAVKVISGGKSTKAPL